MIIPQGFSPNNDRINDYFVIPGIENFPNNKITIFNRWGNIVYESNKYNNEWEGKSNKGPSAYEDLPVGVYYYILDLGDGRNPITGYIYLNR